MSPYLSECVTCMLSVCARTCGVLVKISPGGSKYSFLLDSATIFLERWVAEKRFQNPS